MRQLQVFEAVARNLSFARAARELHLTQPAVSMQVKSLEEQAGLPLFERIGKKIFLTEAGAEMHSHSRAIAQQLRQADEDLALLYPVPLFYANPCDPAGHLRVHIDPVMGDDVPAGRENRAGDARHFRVCADHLNLGRFRGQPAAPEGNQTEKDQEDDSCDDDVDQGTGPVREKTHNAYQDADGRDDNSHNPDPWPCLETSYPEEEIDNPDDEQGDSNGGTNTSKPYDAQDCPPNDPTDNCKQSPDNPEDSKNGYS